MTELKPCPFCARKINLKRHVTEFLDVYMVPECSHCGSFEDLNLLEDDWNTRPIEAELQSEIERLTKERNEAREVAEYYRACYLYHINGSVTQHDFKWENKTDEK